MVEMKSIGLSIPVYLKLLDVKHNFEKLEGHVISYDGVIRKLIDKNNGKTGEVMKE